MMKQIWDEILEQIKLISSDIYASVNPPAAPAQIRLLEAASGLLWLSLRPQRPEKYRGADEGPERGAPSAGILPFSVRHRHHRDLADDECTLCERDRAVGVGDGGQDQALYLAKTLDSLHGIRGELVFDSGLRPREERDLWAGILLVLRHGLFRCNGKLLYRVFRKGTGPIDRETI